jgi:L-amino acid N-acyltransferase YncA
MSIPDARIRLAGPDDASAIAAIYAVIVESTGISFEEVAPGADVMRARIEETTRMYPWLVFEEAGCVVGFAYSYAHRERAAYRWSVDVSVYLAESARGRGVGTKLYSALLCILEAQGFRRVFAGIALPNDASIALHTALGFTRVGIYHDVGYKLGAWRDVAWFERPLAGAQTPPDEPVPLPRLAAPVLAEALSLRG